MSNASSGPFGVNASTTSWPSTRIICEESSGATSATTTDRERTWPSVRRRLSQGRLNFPTRDPSWRFPMSAGSTIATRDERRSFPAVGDFLLGGPVCPGQILSAFSGGSSARGGLQDFCSHSTNAEYRRWDTAERKGSGLW
jgi:hypothetical protein